MHRDVDRIVLEQVEHLARIGADRCGDEVGHRDVADPGEAVHAGAGGFGDQADRPAVDHDHRGAVRALVDQRHGVGHRVVGREDHRRVHDQVAALDEVDGRLRPRRSAGPAAARRCRRGGRRSRPSAGLPPRSCWPPPPGWWCRSRRRWTGRRRSATSRRSEPARRRRRCRSGRRAGCGLRGTAWPPKSSFGRLGASMSASGGTQASTSLRSPLHRVWNRLPWSVSMRP